MTSLCRGRACLREAQRHLVLQMAVADFHLRVLRSRLFRSQGDQKYILSQLSHWDNDRLFYEHLNLALSTNQGEEVRQDYSSGIRFTHN